MIDTGDVVFHQPCKHASIQTLAIELLGLDPIEHLSPKLQNLLHKLCPKVIEVPLLKGLEIILLGQRSDHSAAVPILEERFEQSSDSVLLFYRFRKSFLTG